MEPLSVIIGAVATALVAILAAVVKFIRDRKAADVESQEAGQKVRQSDQSFIADQYRKLVRDHQKDAADLQEQLESLREASSREAHALRDQLQAVCMSEALYKERCRVLEDQVKELRSKPQ